ncbi:MAG: hypothetical protein Q9166_001384 [cf. Caloplaca sp. 2 TL-2023]
MTSRPPSSRAPTGTVANPVRRNLFHSHMTRRPTGAAAAGTTTAPNNNKNTFMPEMQRHDDSSDIIMRDHNGDPQFQMPQMLPMDDEQNGGNEEERERLEERILETYKSRNLLPGDKMEFLSAVQASLRRKVAALDEDNWIYEAEEARPG